MYAPRSHTALHAAATAVCTQVYNTGYIAPALLYAASPSGVFSRRVGRALFRRGAHHNGSMPRGKMRRR